MSDWHFYIRRTRHRYRNTHLALLRGYTCHGLDTREGFTNQLLLELGQITLGGHAEPRSSHQTKTFANDVSSEIALEIVSVAWQICIVNYAIDDCNKVPADLND
jgi:hypothetical protein